MTLVAEQPLVGVATLVLRDGRLLLGQRRKTPGKNTWQCPGGLLQRGESVFECARREVQEETGIAVHNLLHGPYTNNRFPDDQLHSVTLYVVAEYLSGEIQNAEPDRATNWQWFALDDLPRPLFLPLEKLLKNQRTWVYSVAGIAE